MSDKFGSTFTWRAMLDTSSADYGAQQLENKVTKIDKKIKDSNIKLMALWSYGNQIANMALQQAARIAEGSKYQAEIQRLIFGLQIGQTEVAIAQTIAQAMGRFAVQDYLGFALLMSVAGGMQANLMMLIGMEAEARRNEEFASAIQAQIEAYTL